jgi:tetratricopeptide (TPR) repeat protein
VAVEKIETKVVRAADLRLCLIFLFASLAIALLVYRAALAGPFVSDDLLYIANNATVRELDRQGLPALLDPFGAPTLEVGNYAPLLLLAHAAEWRVFGAEAWGYHVVNVALHALCATLLLSLLLRTGVARRLALFAASAFLLHPANVEAVAWISQLKSVLAMALALGALLALERRPLAATGLFAAALLTKAMTAFALPMAAGLVWARSVDAEASRRWAWLAAWLLVLALVTAPQLAATDEIGRAWAPSHADLAAQARFIAWAGWRYVSLAATGLRTSAFHEPGPVGWLSPGWVLGLFAGLALLYRAAWTLRRRAPEGAFWIGALAAFAPISQLIPFYFALGDRYLYFMLPGILGGAALLVQGRFSTAPETLQRVASVLAVSMLTAFAVLSQQRAALWRDELLLLSDSAAHYPEGGTAYYVAAVRATHTGRPDDAIAALRVSVDRGYHFMRPFGADPLLAPLHSRDDFKDLIRDIARRQIAHGEQRGARTPSQLRGMASAYLYLEEYEQAIESYERAIRQGGPLQATLIDELHRAREQRARARGESPSH